MESVCRGTVSLLMVFDVKCMETNCPRTQLALKQEYLPKQTSWLVQQLCQTRTCLPNDGLEKQEKSKVSVSTQTTNETVFVHLLATKSSATLGCLQFQFQQVTPCAPECLNNGQYLLANFTAGKF